MIIIAETPPIIGDKVTFDKSDMVEFIESMHTPDFSLYYLQILEKDGLFQLVSMAGISIDIAIYTPSRKISDALIRVFRYNHVRAFSHNAYSDSITYDDYPAQSMRSILGRANIY